MRNAITRRGEFSPFRMFGEMEREMDRLMENFWSSPGASLENNFLPSFELQEKNGHYIMSFDLPGVPKDEIKVDLAKGTLRIFGERKDKHQEGEYTERRYGKFERTVTLPENVDTEDAQAVFENGVLTIALRKTGEAKVKRLEISSQKSGSLWNHLLSGGEKEKSPKEIKSKKVA
jgi:HSP20 family protein